MDKTRNLNETSEEIVLAEDEEISQDKCICLRLFLMLFSFLLFLASVLSVAFVSSVTSSANSQTLSLTFFLALIFGFYALNLLRIAVNAKWAPSLAAGDTDDEVSCCSHVFVCDDAVAILRDMILVNEIKVQEHDSIRSAPPAMPRDVERGPVDSPKRPTIPALVPLPTPKAPIDVNKIQISLTGDATKVNKRAPPKLNQSWDSPRELASQTGHLGAFHNP